MKRVFLLGNLPIEMPVDRLVTFDELMPDGLEKQLLEKRNLPITAQGIVKMRPDITKNIDNAHKMLRRSSVTNVETLAAVMPELAVATIFVANFKFGNIRQTSHRHLFLPEVSFADGNMVIGNVPSKLDIEVFLNESWGEVKNLEVGFWGGAKDAH